MANGERKFSILLITLKIQPVRHNWLCMAKSWGMVVIASDKSRDYLK
jgi:hypothetical protein